MNLKNIRIVFSALVFFYFSSCAKKVQPDTVHNVNSNGSSELSAVNDSFNSGSVDEFADLGAPINDSLDDGLSLRDPTLSSFNDERASRPFEPVLFGFDQYNIQASERAKISRIADYMKSNPSARLLIEGYCDWKGTPDYNKSLGDRRAKTVKEYLTDLGCEENRIEVISIGDELATPNASSEIARLDRRATFVVSE